MAKKVAAKTEVLEYLTHIMRREDEDIKFSDSFKAAELLGKYHGLFKSSSEDEYGDVIIVDDIEENREKKQTKANKAQ